MTTTQKTTPCPLKLVDYHHPLLRQIIEPVQFPLSKKDKQLINDMKHAIQKEHLKEDAVGMAANQWGINKRIFLFCPEDTADGLEIIINPSYKPLSDTTMGSPLQDLTWECCFSIPLATGHVKRYTHIQVIYQNPEGKTIVRELKGLPARIWQHENDHLNGLLYDDLKAGKCTDKREFTTDSELDNFFKNLRKSFEEPLQDV